MDIKKYFKLPKKGNIVTSIDNKDNPTKQKNDVEKVVKIKYYDSGKTYKDNWFLGKEEIDKLDIAVGSIESFDEGNDFVEFLIAKNKPHHALYAGDKIKDMLNDSRLVFDALSDLEKDKEYILFKIQNSDSKISIKNLSSTVVDAERDIAFSRALLKAVSDKNADEEFDNHCNFSVVNTGKVLSHHIKNVLNEANANRFKDAYEIGSKMPLNVIYENATYDSLFDNYYFNEITQKCLQYLCDNNQTKLACDMFINLNKDYERVRVERILLEGDSLQDKNYNMAKGYKWFPIEAVNECVKCAKRTGDVDKIIDLVKVLNEDPNLIEEFVITSGSKADKEKFASVFKKNIQEKERKLANKKEREEMFK